MYARTETSKVSTEVALLHENFVHLRDHVSIVYVHNYIKLIAHSTEHAQFSLVDVTSLIEGNSHNSKSKRENANCVMDLYFLLKCEKLFHLEGT